MNIADRIIHRINNLETERGTWEAHWQEIANFVFPNHPTFIGAESKGIKKAFKAYDSTAIHASEMLAAGLHGRLTNPASNWFELSFKDKSLNDSRQASIWLSAAQSIMYDEMQNAITAFTSHIHEMYLEFAVFGTGILYTAENMKKDGLLYKAIPLSEGFIAENDDGVVDTLYRVVLKTVEQLVQKYSKEGVSSKVLKLWQANKFDELVEVVHAVEPREVLNIKPKLKDKLPWVSVFIERSTKHVLSISGFEEFPYAVPRYYRASGEVYGRGAAVTSLPDIKMLNEMMKTTIASAQKALDPPLQAPDDGFVGPIRTVPGGLNYFRAGTRERIEPINTGGNVNIGIDFMNEIRSRIQKIFFVDQLELGRRPEMTATEVVQRTDDMLRLMGPVMGRLQAEGLNTIINRSFSILAKQKKFPEIPADIAGVELDILYTSPIARAQKQLEATGIQRVLEILNPWIAVDPAILGRFDTAEMLSVTAEMFGLRPSFLKSKDAFKEEQKEQREITSEQSQLEQLKVGSEAGLNIAKIGDLSGQNQL